MAPLSIDQFQFFVFSSYKQCQEQLARLQGPVLRNQRANAIITQHYHRVLKQILPKIPKSLLTQTVDSWLDSNAILVPEIDLKTYNTAS